MSDAPATAEATDESTLSSGPRRATGPTGQLMSFVLYFLKLGTIGFGGPVALVGFMHRDLVERRRIVHEDTYPLAVVPWSDMDQAVNRRGVGMDQRHGRT